MIQQNSFAKAKDLPDGTVVVAENQTAGRGRKGRKWVSTYKKGLYFTIVLKEKIPVNEMLPFSFIFPISVKNAVEDLLGIDNIRIKMA
ncbi:MAG: hypothetical protein Q9M89_03690 [Persephonella sp.]|nr:hypothetical protein [Persephonella sp.]